MSTAMIIAGLGAAALAWLATDFLLRDHRRRARWARLEADMQRRQASQERLAQANGHPRTGNVSHLGPLR